MKNGDSKNRDGERSDNLTPSASEVKTGTKSGKSKNTTNKSRQQKKWSLWRHWKSASRPRQLKWLLEGVVVATGVAVLGSYIWQNLQTKWNFQAEHKPIVVHSRPPQLLQEFKCDATNNAFRTGNMNVFIKNIGNAIASRVPYSRAEMKIVPEKKSGESFFDDPPQITPTDCEGYVGGGKMETSLAPGEEKMIQIRQNVGTVPPNLKNGELIQLYIARCVYYFDDYRANHGTCDTYRLYVPSKNTLDNLLGTPSIPCDGKEVTGRFVANVWGNCQK